MVTEGTEPVGAAWPGQTIPPTCPFFRSVAVDGALRPPIEAPDGANRCAAFGAPRQQSPLQQELVCLTAGHVDCPRYLQGSVRVREEAARREWRRRFTRPTIGALLFVLVCAGASFAFVLTRGGLLLPAAPAGAEPTASTPLVAAVPDATPSLAVTPAPPTLAPTPRPTERPPTAPPTAAPAPDPTPAPTPRPTQPPPPPVTPTQPPPSSRYALLDRCPDRPDCWIYTVRAGDNLWSIGNYFGHTLETIYRLNPSTRTEPIRVGQQLILPPPTR